jgi:hypothetical protein
MRADRAANTKLWNAQSRFAGLATKVVPSIIRRLPQILLMTAITLVLLELALQVAVRLGVLSLSLPTYSITRTTPFWLDINEHFGVWHPASSHYRHYKSCFDVVYASNSLGMRYKKAEVASRSQRVVFLGDSFVEGYGIADGARFTDRLENMTGFDHLNFGTAQFGPVQSYVLYKTLASEFDHNAVIFAIYPNNDFLDDLPVPSRLRRGARYRPYLVGDYPDYELRYPPGGLGPDYQLGARLSSIAMEFSLTGRAVEYASTIFRTTILDHLRSARLKRPLTSSYYDYDADEFNRLRYSIEQIKDIAANRPMLIVTIPGGGDVIEFERLGRKRPPLTEELVALSEKLGITYIDLLEKLHPYDLDNYYLACDQHLSPAGHQWAADAMATWDFYRERR